MNRSKLYEWLLDNDCPFEWETVDSRMTTTSCTLVFTDKEKETEVRDMTDKEYWNSPEIKELLNK